MRRSIDLPSPYPYTALQGSSSSDQQHECNVGGRPWWEWTLLGVTFLNVGCFLGFTVVDLVETIQSSLFESSVEQTMGLEPIIDLLAKDYANPAFTFDLIALLATGMTPVLILYGILSEKKYEICLCPLIMALALLFCIPEVIVNTETTQRLIFWQKIARLLSCGLLTIISLPLTYKTVSEKTWLEFTITGTSDCLMGMYKRLRYFTALLKFDFFCVCILGIFCLRSGLQSNYDFVTMAAVIIYAIVSLVIGTLAVNREIKGMVFAFVTLGILLPLWVPFEIMSFDCFTPHDDINTPFNATVAPDNNCNDNTLLVAGSSVVAGFLALITKVYISVELLRVYKNFGFGLTDAAFVGLVDGESSSLLGRQRRRPY